MSSRSPPIRNVVPVFVVDEVVATADVESGRDHVTGLSRAIFTYHQAMVTQNDVHACHRVGSTDASLDVVISRTTDSNIVSRPKQDGVITANRHVQWRNSLPGTKRTRSDSGCRNACVISYNNVISRT